MRPTASRLIKQKVRYTVHENELYFDVSELKQLYPNLKFPPDKIKQLHVKGVSTNTIRPQDVEEMTDFDKKVLQFMKFNPKEQ
jgi:hypothetical protein